MTEFRSYGVSSAEREFASSVESQSPLLAQRCEEPKKAAFSAQIDKYIPAGKTLTEDCRKELAEFKTDRGTNINKNVPLGKLSGILSKVLLLI